MLVTRPALFATVCSGLWLLQMGLMGAMAARWWGLWTLTRVQLAWCGAALAGATLVLGALLLAQLPRAARWRPRLTPRASAELQAERKRIARDLHDKLGSQLINALALLLNTTLPALLSPSVSRMITLERASERRRRLSAVAMALPMAVPRPSISPTSTARSSPVSER